MSETKHTPGPWTVDGPAQYTNVHGCMVYATDGNGHLVAECKPEYSDNQQDNARLISAAPELLESCEDLWKKLDRLILHCDNDGSELSATYWNCNQAPARLELEKSIQTAQQAIRKAKGE